MMGLQSSGERWASFLQVKLIPAARSIIGFEAEQLAELRASLGADVDILSESAEPFAVGHVVSHVSRGRGTVTEHMPGDLFGSEGRVKVVFDSGEEHRYCDATPTVAPNPPSVQCPMPNAPCPMPNAQCPNPQPPTPQPITHNPQRSPSLLGPRPRQVQPEVAAEA